MHARHVLSLGNFFSAAHFFLIVYIIGPYLAQFMSVSATGLVVSAGAVLSLIAFVFSPRLVRKYGAKRLAVYLAFIQAVVLSVLAGNPGPAIAIVAVALVCAITPIIGYQLDLLLEATVAQESTTGRVRTAFLTAGNIALVLAPLAIGFLLNGTNRYDFIFLAAAISLTPFIMLLLVERIPEGAPPKLRKLTSTCVCIAGDRDLRSVAIANGTLQLFFHLAPLYVPLYLHTTLGIPWSDLGWVFALAMLPFVFVEYPAGWLADRYLGDRTLLSLGFLVMGVCFSAFAFVTAATPLWIILAILIGTRIGAALAESMIESHFFRRITERDASTVSAFRMMRPVGALVAPLAGSLLLTFASYSFLFFTTGIVIALMGALAVRSMRESVTVADIAVPASVASPQLQAS